MTIRIGRTAAVFAIALPRTHKRPIHSEGGGEKLSFEFRQSQDTRLKEQPRLGKDGAALLRSGDTGRRPRPEDNEAAPASTAIDDGPKGAKIARQEKQLDFCRCRSSRATPAGVSTQPEARREWTNRQKSGTTSSAPSKRAKPMSRRRTNISKLDRDGNGLREYAGKMRLDAGNPRRPLLAARRGSGDLTAHPFSLKTPICVGVRVRRRSHTTACSSILTAQEGSTAPFPTSSMAT